MALNKEKIIEDLKTLPGRLVLGLRELPELLGQPRLLLQWMRQNPRVPLAALAVLIAVPLLLPGADYLLEQFYHPVVKKELLGLLTTIEVDERLVTRQIQVRWLLWMCAAAASAAILLLQVPHARREVGCSDVDGTPDSPSRADPTIVERAPEVRTVGPGSRYLIEAELGRGTMGIVYRAKDTVLDRVVAVKELPAHIASDLEGIERFRREARALANLAHAGVVQVFDLLDHESGACLVMELVKGGNLQDHFNQSGKIPLARAYNLGYSIAQALDYVHGRGIIHRDLKPANILLTEEGVPKITDFGVARWTHESGLTLAGSVIGSPNYMSPEQAAGKVADHRSDLYSYGALLYWLVTGTTPYSGDVRGVLSQHMTGTLERPSARNSSVSENVERIVVSLMEKDPDLREQDLGRTMQVLSDEIGGFDKG